MSNEECKSLTSSSLSMFQERAQTNFFDNFDCSEVQRELMKIRNDDELANWFHNFNSGLLDGFSLLTWIAGWGDEDAILYEFMKKVTSLGEKIVVFDRSPRGGELLVKINPDKEKPSVVVDWFDYSESANIKNDFCMKVCNDGMDDYSMHIVSQNGDWRCSMDYVAITAGRFYGALDLAIKNSKNLNYKTSLEKDCYALIKKK